MNGEAMWGWSRRARVSAAVVAIFALPLLGCGADVATEFRIEAGPEAGQRLRVALAGVGGARLVTLSAGRFALDTPIVVDKPGVTIRGQGMRRTTLDFSSAVAGSGDGVVALDDGFVLEDLTITGAFGDAVRIQKARGVIIRRVRIDWPGEPGPANGAYGLYPVECEDIVVEDNVIRGAADSGVYVGQSERVLVRGNEVFESVAGIQIENARDVDVRDNSLHDNAAGILAFALPELVGTTRRVRIAGNKILQNNEHNFAPAGARVAEIPSGSGIILMAADDVEIRDNRIAHNQTTNLAVYSHFVMQESSNNRLYDPHSEHIWIHGNRLEGGGDKPTGTLAHLIRSRIGLPFPDIIIGGSENPARFRQGRVSPNHSVYISNNGDADFVELDLKSLLRGGRRGISRDLSPYSTAPRSFPQPASPRLP